MPEQEAAQADLETVEGQEAEKTEKVLELGVEAIQEIVRAAILYRQGDAKSVVDMMIERELNDDEAVFVKILLKDHKFTDGQIKYIIECIESEDYRRSDAAYHTINDVSDFDNTFLLLLKRCEIDQRLDIGVIIDNLCAVAALISTHPEKKSIIHKHLKFIEDNCFIDEPYIGELSATVFEALKDMFPKKAKKYSEWVELLNGSSYPETQHRGSGRSGSGH
jgi:hypothetical protein